MRNISKFVEKIENIILYFTFPKIVPLMRQVRKCGTIKQTTDDNIIRRILFVCWISKATDSTSEFLIFNSTNAFVEASQRDVIHTFIVTYPLMRSLIQYEFYVSAQTNI